ncbi:MAG: hypothetical protein JNK38_21715 [Acidobacteria bacterium]|nr:hypothetical protein [Acidobacteriota bacterium]
MIRMSRSHNAVDFRQKYLQIRFEYEETYRGQIEKIRAIYERSEVGATPSDVNDCLEAHFREYFVNSFLQALNWRLNITLDKELPNLIPESPVASVSRGTKRRLDYLGIEQETQRPLLIVETKHPRSPLPQRRKSSNKPSYEQSVSDSWPSVISDGLRGQELMGEWNDWLKALRDYVLDVQDKSQTIPKRVILTNGHWLILFTDPADSFLPSGSRDANRIFAFTYEDNGSRKRDDFADRCNDIFEFLEHQRVLGETQPLNVGELAFHLSSEEVSGAMHGLRLMYVEKPGLYAASPIIDVTPVILLRSTHGAWLRVESGKEDQVPHRYEQLSDHLYKVKEEASQLLRKINEVLGIDLKSYKLQAHYSNDEMFKSLKGVTKLKSGGHYEEYLIVTGEHAHYLKPEPSIAACPHHNWGYSNQQSCAEPRLVSIQRRSTDPHSFFITGEEHHCAHREVSAAKASQIKPGNQERCGARSGIDYDAFCEIWAFEKHLCCRTCVFERICTNAPIFKLPCKVCE